MENVEVPDGVTKIEEKAFWFCHNLMGITIPDSVTEIESKFIIYESRNCKIYCHENSYAQTYAESNSYEYVLVDGDLGEAMRAALSEDKSESLTLKKKKIILQKSQKAKIKITSELTTQPSYESLNPSIATVNANGVIKAKKKGKTTVLVQANGETRKVKVTVKASSSDSVVTIKLSKDGKLSKTKASLKKGTKLTIKKVSGVSGKVTFQTLNKKIATVSVKGVVKARRKGRTTILIKNNGKTVKLKLTVKR